MDCGRGTSLTHVKFYPSVVIILGSYLKCEFIRLPIIRKIY